MKVESAKYWLEFQGSKSATFRSLEELMRATQADPWKQAKLGGATLRVKLVTVDLQGRRMVRRAWWPAEHLLALQYQAKQLGWDHIGLWSRLHDERKWQRGL